MSEFKIILHVQEDLVEIYGNISVDLCKKYLDFFFQQGFDVLMVSENNSLTLVKKIHLDEVELKEKKRLSQKSEETFQEKNNELNLERIELKNIISNLKQELMFYKTQSEEISKKFIDNKNEIESLRLRELAERNFSKLLCSQLPSPKESSL